MADSRIIGSKNVRLLSSEVTLAAAVESGAMTFDVNANRGVSIYTLSDKSGTLQPQIFVGRPTAAAPEVMPSAGWKDMGSSVAVTANVLAITEFVNRGMLPMRVAFTPGSGGNYLIDCIAQAIL